MFILLVELAAPDSVIKHLVLSCAYLKVRLHFEHGCYPVSRLTNLISKAFNIRPDKVILS